MPEATYDMIGVGYARYRRPDRRIAAQISEALGPARSVLNVGAGTGSYEAFDRHLIAVEPSAEMVRQRAPQSAAVVRGVAEALPFRDRAVDAVMAVLTVHHWRDWRQGLAEMRRVSNDRVVILTWTPDHGDFWLTAEYFPEIISMDRKIFPALSEIGDHLGSVEVRVVPVPHDCSDGFLGAYWRRPEYYLDPGARQAISGFSRLPNVANRLKRLEWELESGIWKAKYAEILAKTELDLGYRLIIGKVASCA